MTKVCVCVCVCVCVFCQDEESEEEEGVRQSSHVSIHRDSVIDSRLPQDR